MPYAAVGIIVFFALALGFVFISMLLNHLIAPSKLTPLKAEPYECGEKVVGNARVRFDMRFYIIALAFIVFDAEVVFFFPWALKLKTLRYIAFVDMLIFIVILVAGLFYIWKRGDLRWVKTPVR